MKPKNNVIDELMEHEFFKNNLDNFDVFLKYITARFDIKNYGNRDNDLVILEYSDSECEIEAPSLFKTNEGAGWKIQSKKVVIELKIKCIKEGQLRIYIRGNGYKRNNQEVVIDINFT